MVLSASVRADSSSGQPPTESQARASYMRPSRCSSAANMPGQQALHAS
ncbi:MAG: hypothetical protein V4717_01495 [Bacteroidota bacterium]